MIRREFISSAAIAAATLAAPGSLAAEPVDAAGVEPAPASTIHVSVAAGSDSNPGTREAPLRSLAEAARRVNLMTGRGAITVILAEGTYAVTETARFTAKHRHFSATERLTIRAEILPDDPAWDWGRMPTFIHVLPLSDTWNGLPDPLGGAIDGMQIETSHASVLGLRFLGLPVIEKPRASTVKRVYAIARLPHDLDDLEIGHCVFAGDPDTNPLHVAIIAHGNGVNLHHSIFRNIKISIVYWGQKTSGHRMTHCICDGLYGSSVWTSEIADDFVFANNVIANGNYAWTWQRGLPSDSAALFAIMGIAPPPLGTKLSFAPELMKPLNAYLMDSPNLNHYRVIDSYLAHNRRLSGTGTGASLDYKDISSGFLQMAGTTVTDAGIAFEGDQMRRDYLHPVAGSPAARTGAGLFTAKRD